MYINRVNRTNHSVEELINFYYNEEDETIWFAEQDIVGMVIE